MILKVAGSGEAAVHKAAIAGFCPKCGAQLGSVMFAEVLLQTSKSSILVDRVCAMRRAEPGNVILFQPRKSGVCGERKAGDDAEQAEAIYDPLSKPFQASEQCNLLCRSSSIHEQPKRSLGVSKCQVSLSCAAAAILLASFCKKLY